jgi:hypothetical protein
MKENLGAVGLKQKKQSARAKASAQPTAEGRRLPLPSMFAALAFGKDGGARPGGRALERSHYLWAEFYCPLTRGLLMSGG